MQRTRKLRDRGKSDSVGMGQEKSREGRERRMGQEFSRVEMRSSRREE